MDVWIGMQREAIDGSSMICEGTFVGEGAAVVNPDGSILRAGKKHQHLNLLI